MIDLHIEKLGARLEELRRKDPRIIALLGLGMEFDVINNLNDEDLEYLLRKRREEERKIRYDKKRTLKIHMDYHRG